MHLNHSLAFSQRGFSLIEAMVAIVVMALGILGILGVQLRTLTDTQTGVRRAQAIRLIEDLSERTKSNPDAIGNASAYVSNWGATLSTPKDCSIASGFPATSCTPAELAAYDKDRWLRSVRAALPLGDAAIFVSSSDTRELGVMIAWRANERGDSATDSAYTAVFAPANTGGAAITCPAGKICHLQYIRLTQRCLPDTASSSTVYCPE
jgi:type IV pilus assembly protein PilV